MWLTGETLGAGVSHNLGTLNQLLHLFNKLQNRKCFIVRWERAPPSDAIKANNLNAVLPNAWSKSNQCGLLEDDSQAQPGEREGGVQVYSQEKGLMKSKWNVLECSRSKLRSSLLRRENSVWDVSHSGGLRDNWGPGFLERKKNVEKVMERKREGTWWLTLRWMLYIRCFISSHKLTSREVRSCISLIWQVGHQRHREVK